MNKPFISKIAYKKILVQHIIDNGTYFLSRLIRKSDHKKKKGMYIKENI